MTSLPAAIVSALFISSSILFTAALWVAGTRVAYKTSGLLEADPLKPSIYSLNFRNGIAVLCGPGVFASLKFMWDVRHPKTD